MGRILLFAAAVLLLVAGIIHAAGQSMVDGWVSALPEFQKQAICLVWVTDSVSWAAVAAIWAIAGWRQDRGWLGASAVGILIPLSTAAGIMGIDPTFFGGWMLLGSIALAATGLALSRRSLRSRSNDS